MSKRSKISMIIGGIVSLASVVIYAIVRPSAFPSSILGLYFLLYSEIVLFGGFVLIDLLTNKTSNLLLWSGVGVPLGIYAVVVFISSLVFMAIHTIAVQNFLILQIVLFVLTAAICLIIGNFSARAKRQDEKTLEAERTVQYAIDQLTLIKERTDKKSDVNRLIEGLRSSDASVTVDSDVEISEAIDVLDNLIQSDDASEEEFSNAIKSIEFFIKKRNLQTRASKLGGI